MGPVLLAVVLWHAPAAVRAPNDAAQAIELPAVSVPARLVLRVRAFRYDGSGHEHVAAWRLKRRHGGAFLRVHLAPDEAAVVACDH